MNRTIRIIPTLCAFVFTAYVGAQQTLTLPQAPSALLISASTPDSSSDDVSSFDQATATGQTASGQSATANQDPLHGDHPFQKAPCIVDPSVEVDKDCKPIPIERQQPHRILGFMPNFRSVSAGGAPHPPGWKYNFEIASKQAFDYSSFIFLGLTTLSAEGINEHPVLGKGVNGFWNYGWRGFLDKTDGTYIGAWFLPSLLHEDTRYYAMGNRRSIPIRALYVISRQGVTRTYGGHQTPNIAGLGGKVLTQLVSRQYYPTGATSFGVLAEKFGYAAMRDVAFTSIREFYPDIAAHYIRKHRAKVAAAAARDASAAQATSAQPH